jgi:Spy/CpxP family protein refolding chaperone
MNTLSIKTLFIITAATLMFAASAAAQNGQGNGGNQARGHDRGAHHGPADAETRVAHMTRMLDLSDEQSAELLEVMQAVDRERMALHEQAYQDMEPEICALQLNVAAEIRTILSEDQMAILEARRNEREKDRLGKSWRGMPLDCSAYE